MDVLELTLWVLQCSGCAVESGAPVGDREAARRLAEDNGWLVTAVETLCPSCSCRLGGLVVDGFVGTDSGGSGRP